MIDGAAFERIDKPLRDAVDLILRGGMTENTLQAKRLIEQARVDLARLRTVVFGMLPADSVVPKAAQQIEQPIRGELTCNCPRCGAALCFTIAETGVHLRINS